MAQQQDTKQVYRLVGAEESPYSVKVRSYLRYKQLPHQWLTRVEAPDLYQQHARLPLIPLLVTPEGRGLQDSTPIIEQIEEVHASPSIHPEESVSRFVSILLEEFADEWGNKWMFHYRWARPVDQLACSHRLAKIMAPDAGALELEDAAMEIRDRMVNRIWFVGSSPQTAKQIEESFKDTLALLENHLTHRPYLFGARPAFADFGLWGQLYNAYRDPTPREIIQMRAPATLTWIKRMENPETEGVFESWATLAKTLQPLLADQVGGLFLPWSHANESAITQDAAVFSVMLRSGTWEQKPQKYHARSLQTLRSRYSEFVDDTTLDDVLRTTGCLSFLT